MLPGATPIPGGCAAEEAAALAAVAGLGYPVMAVDISPYGFPCGVPFPGDWFASGAPGCPISLNGPTAYVSFFGTAKVAGLAFGTTKDGVLVASVVEFEVPPTGVAPA